MKNSIIAATKPPIVTVDEIKPVDRGVLRAFCTITIAGKLTIHSVRIIEEPGKAAWVSLPQNQVLPAGGGKAKYFPIVEVTDENLKQQITTAVLQAWRAQKQ